MEKVNEYNVKKYINLSAFTKFLKDWVLSHIAIIDKRYFEYLRMTASRKADGVLSITRADVG
jgi:hemerythrin